MRYVTRLLLVLLPLAFGASPGQAQILKKLKEKAKTTVEKAIENPPEKAQQEQQEEQAAVQEPTAEKKAAMKPGEGAWANYDYVPGDRVLYDDDFTKDVVGDFPRRMEFKAGALEIVDWQGGRWLRATRDSRFYIVLPEPLPSRFTMEFDYSIPNGQVWIFFGPDENHSRVDVSGDAHVIVHNFQTEITADGRYSEDTEYGAIRRIRFLGDGRYVKVYIDDKRILNVPNADLPRTNMIQLFTDASVDEPALFGNFRVAAGGKKLYDALTAEGRVATQGILFDTNSDRIRPESTPTLKEIGTMLTEHPELKLLIEGHTDNVGDDAANLTLSDKRAAAVKAYLVSKHGIDATRLQTKGLGETKPAATNDTAEGRQQNRRVELVKL
ncbi:MAG: OmpA family protein [Gemmatimonadetes bacterium]|nr:OmpA family protein [Gemmatimonadota bacterium]